MIRRMTIYGLAVAAWLVFAMTAPAARAAEFEFFMMMRHQSDLFRAPPEPTNDYVTPLGLTIRWGKHRQYEVDISTGWKAIDCPGARNCDWESGSELGLKWYAFRK